MNYAGEGPRSTIVLFDSDSGDINELDEPAGVAGMALGGSTLVLQRYDGSVAAVDVRNRRQRWALPAQSLTDDTNPAVSPDGRLAAVMRPDGVTLLLDAATGARIGEIRAQLIDKAGLAFSGDSRRLLIGIDAVNPDENLDEAEIQQWLVAPDDLVAEACLAAGRELTDAERDRFFAGLATTTGHCRP